MVYPRFVCNNNYNCSLGVHAWAVGELVFFISGSAWGWLKMVVVDHFGLAISCFWFDVIVHYYD
jgi:hypothetical protein